MRDVLETLLSFLLGLMVSLHPTQPAAQQFKQFELTEQQVLSFIAANQELNRIAGGSASHDTQAVTAKHGFESIAEFNNVAANVRLIAARIEPHTRDFIDVQLVIAALIDVALKDSAHSKAEKDQFLEYLHNNLGHVTPIKYRTNIALVQLHYSSIERCCDASSVRQSVDLPVITERR